MSSVYDETGGDRASPVPCRNPGIFTDRRRIDGIPSPDLPVFRESAGICFRFLGDHM